MKKTAFIPRIYQYPYKVLLFSQKNLRTYLAISSLLFFVTGLLSCAAVKVYKEPDEPLFQARAKDPQPVKQADSLNVVTFNIKKAEKTELAAYELQQFQQTRNIDVYLLQEMDKKGVEVIAKTLNLNYLYIPVQYRTSAKKDVGNAILTHGTIDCPEKLMLPHSKWLSRGRREVTIAEVSINEKKILVYSVHTETAVLGKKKRMDQLDTIIKHAQMELPNYKYVLIGGDFNTLLSKDGQSAIEKFNGGGFDWSTAAAGKTARNFFGLVKSRHDYIFSKGLKPMTASKIEESRSSDHYPVLATFAF